MGRKIGYARVSTNMQELGLQLDRKLAEQAPKFIYGENRQKVCIGQMSDRYIAIT